MKTATEEMLKDNQLTVVVLTENAVNQYRIPKAEKGMAFVVDKFTKGINGYVAHVRDFRYMTAENGALPKRDYAIWSISADMYEIAYAVAL